MDSLLASYASSDEEGGGGGGRKPQKDEVPEDKPTASSPSKPSSTSIPPFRSSSSSPFSSLPPSKSCSSSSLFSSLPPPKSSSSSSSVTSTSSSALFSSLPPPKSASLFSSLPPPRSATTAASSASSLSSSSSLFSSLPPPKSQRPKPPPSSETPAKRFVQFRPPITSALLNPVDDDDDDRDDDHNRKGKRRAEDLSSKPLSSIIPAPKHTLGLGPSSRRSVIRADVPAAGTEAVSEQAGGEEFVDTASYGGPWKVHDGQSGVDVQPDPVVLSGGDDAAASGWTQNSGSYDAYGAYGCYQGYENYGNYGGDWNYESAAAGAISATPTQESAISTKRGRGEIPSEIVEVKQDELIKNRPREDQIRMTGIAFGPAYQQPASSGKGKPSKLHRRKHQIGSLYFDMRQKEMELAERRARGFLTKKETQAKYGW